MESPAFMTNEAAAQQQGGMLSRGGAQQGQSQEQPQQEGEQATPEEQAQYEKMIANAMNTLHGENSDKIIEKLSNGEPDEAVGEVVVSLIIKLYESADQSGTPLMDSVMLYAGEEILNEVVNLGMISGAFGDIDEDEGEDIQQEAMMFAMDKLGRYLEAQGRFNHEELQAGVDAANNGAFDKYLSE